MFKKVLIASLIFFLIALGIAGYFIFYKKPVPSLTVTNNSNNPFSLGTSTRVIPTQGSNTASPDANNSQIAPAPFMHLSSEPASGATFLASATSTVRFVDQATGHIFDVNLLSGAGTKTTNTTIPKVYRAVWPSDTNVLFQYLDDSSGSITTYNATLTTPATSTASSTIILKEVHGTFLSSDIESLAVAPSKKNIFLLSEGYDGATGVVRNSATGKTSQLFSSPFGEWIAGWPEENTISLTTKASHGLPGYMYTLNVKTGGLTKILDAISGLTTNMNPSGTKVLYSDDRNSVSVYDVKNNITIPLSISTLAEKCVWSQKLVDTVYCAVPTSIPDGNYPDSWYQGSVSFIDSIYEINVDTNTSTLVSNIQNLYGESVDATHLILSSDEHYLMFNNKKDLTLWSLNLAQ